MSAKYPKVNYIGNKEKLASWIVKELPIKSGCVLDIFSGGASVSYYLKKHGFSVIANDILYSNYVISKALIENEENKLNINVFKTPVTLEDIKYKKESIQFLQDKLYYDYEILELAKLLCIAEKLTENEKYMFLALLRRAMIRKLPYSRMNVPWNQIQILRDEEYSYEKYKRRRAYHNESFEEHMIKNLDAYNNAVFKNLACKSYNLDVLDMIEIMPKVDLVYMDPPYPSTMNNYDGFYGPYDEIFKKKKTHIEFTKKETFISNLEIVIEKMKDKTSYVVISLNSKVVPTVEEIEQRLKKFGTVKVKEKEHTYKVTGKINKNKTKEQLLILEFNR